jgi:chromosome segregation ATPase
LRPLDAIRSKRPSYAELKAQNDELESQLAKTHEEIEQAQSDLQNLRVEVESVSSQPCHEESAGDLDDAADQIGSSLDDAEDDSQ